MSNTNIHYSSHDILLTAAIALILTIAASMHIHAAGDDGNHIPDSMLTEGHVYEVTFTDPALGHRIIDAMRQRTDTDDYTLNILEGDLYFNNRKATQALIYYRRSLNSDSVRLNTSNRKDVWHRMISCFDLLHDEDNKMLYAKQLMQLAIETDDKPTEAIAKFAMGKSFYNQGNTRMGFEYMRQATSIMEESDYKYKYDNLRYFYNTLIIYYIREAMDDEALEMADALENVVTQTAEGEFEIDNLNNKELKSLYAQKAVILQLLGRNDEAKQYYDKWNTIKDYTQDDYLIMPYLFKMKMYDEIIAYGKQLETVLTNDSNKVNYHMITAYKNMAKAYKLKGDYRNSSNYFEKAYEQNDEIKRDEQQSTVAEMAAIYDLNEKNQIISDARHRILLQRVILVSTSIIIMLLATMLWLTIRKRKETRKQNFLLAQQIKHYTDLAESYRKSLMAHKAIAKDTNGNNTAGNTSSAALFAQLEEMMLRDKPYRNPDLTRDDIVTALFTNKNKLIEAIKEAKGMTFTDYVNSIRMSEAALLLGDNPDINIEQVSKMVGFGSPSTLYRQFKTAYGMSPNDYRRYVSQLNSSDKANND